MKKLHACIQSLYHVLATTLLWRLLDQSGMWPSLHHALHPSKTKVLKFVLHLRLLLQHQRAQHEKSPSSLNPIALHKHLLNQNPRLHPKLSQLVLPKNLQSLPSPSSPLNLSPRKKRRRMNPILLTLRLSKKSLSFLQLSLLNLLSQRSPRQQRPL
jgi:hypothetical protein